MGTAEILCAGGAVFPIGAGAGGGHIGFGFRGSSARTPPPHTHTFTETPGCPTSAQRTQTGPHHPPDPPQEAPHCWASARSAAPSPSQSQTGSAPHVTRSSLTGFSCCRIRPAAAPSLAGSPAGPTDRTGPGGVPAAPHVLGNPPGRADGGAEPHPSTSVLTELICPVQIAVPMWGDEPGLRAASGSHRGAGCAL